MTASVHILTGIPGSGKTHWILDQLPLYERHNVWSLNLIRYEFAKRYINIAWHTIRNEPDAHEYTKIWRTCNEHKKEFNQTANGALHRMMREAKRGVPLFIDNTNLYKSGREFVIGQCRQYKAHITGVFVDTCLDVCLERQDRGMSRERLSQMYIDMKIPSASEYDEFLVVEDSN